MSKGTWTALGKEKLASSGLTVKQAEGHGMYEVPSAAQLDKSFAALPAIVLPYHGTDGKPTSARAKWPSFYRIRYLAKGNGFGDLATDKSQRYAQPPKTGTCAYFPRCIAWDTVRADTAQAIVFTEGEFKAAAACEQGFNTIGLGGVWNFQSLRDGIGFLPELATFDWVMRKVYICYDSDAKENTMVSSAINRLSEQLEERGAVVAVTMLPEVDGKKKTGLDDYLLEYTDDDFEELLGQSPALGMSRSLWEINNEIAYVEDPGFVVVLDTGQKMEAGKFKEHSRWATMSTTVSKIGAKGEVQRALAPAAPEWIKWPLRNSVSKITYRPGAPMLTEANEYNGWRGWGVQPVKGDVKPWLDLTKFIFQDLEKADLDWFYDWCAYPLQNPGVKMYAAVVVHGVHQGTGKSQIGYTLGRIYGKNFNEITSDELDNGNTWWAENKQFIMGDEITGNDNRQHSNMLKRLITQEQININIKFVPQFTIPDCINYYFTAQHGDSFFLEDRDRRFFVNEVREGPLPDKFYATYDKWLKREGGDKALFHWLLERKISPKFNPFGHAPSTEAKQRMIQMTKGDLGQWIKDMLENPSHVLINGATKHAKDLFTSGELTDIYSRAFPNNKITAAGMARALSSAGIAQVANGAPLRGTDGKLNRYFAVRRIDYWRKLNDRKKMEANIAMRPVPRTGYEEKGN